MSEALMTVTPDIESRWILVANSKQIKLAAEAANWFTNIRKYVIFFEFPSLDHPYTGSTDFGTDGYIAKASGDRAATSINNAAARIQPELIVLLGIDENGASFLRARLPHKLIFEAATIEELTTRLSFTPEFLGEVLCRPNEIMRGLATARLGQKRLIVTKKAEPLPTFIRTGGRGLVVVEEENEINEISAINLALAAQMDILFVPAVQQTDLRDLPGHLHDWSLDSSHHSYQTWKRRVRNSLRAVSVRSYEHVTFFTTGLPYGLFIENSVRCCHVQKYRETCDAIVNAIVDERDPTRFASALLFSPELFSSEETKELAIMLRAQDFRTKLLLGEEATVGNLSDFGSHYPYDLLHICSHGGQTDGYFTIRSFKDREGAQHTIEYYEVVGFQPSGGEMVHVTAKMIFHKLDGYRWMSPPLESFPKYVFDDMFNSIRSEDKVNRIRYKSPITRSCHIKCYSSIHQGDFQQLAGFGHPLVFNNTCASSHELELSFLHAGARAYIGTLWNVGNNAAKEAALTFYRRLEMDSNLSSAFHEMVTGISERKYRNIYVYWGFNFSTLRLSNPTKEDAILPALLFLWRVWIRKVNTTLDLEVKTNCLPIIRFITEELLSELEAQHVTELEDFQPSAVSEIERSIGQQKSLPMNPHGEFRFDDSGY